MRSHPRTRSLFAPLGFTLVEVLMASAIICLLIIVAIQGLRSSRLNSQRNICIGNLRIIEAAKNEWALQDGIKGSIRITNQWPDWYENQVNRYLTSFKTTTIPRCPAGGSYEYGSTTRFEDNTPVSDDERPTCSLKNSHKHKLPVRSFEQPA